MIVHVYEYCGRWVARCSAGIVYGTSEHDAFWKLIARLRARR